MQTLILSPFFFPEPISTGRYNTALAQGLVGAGTDTAVACSHPLYPAWEPCRSDAELPGVQILRGGLRLRYPGSPALRRMLLELWFTTHAAVQAWRLRKKLDRVVAVFPPSLFFIIVPLLLPRTVRRVGIVHDLQGVHAEASASRIARALSGVIRLVERRAFRSCDRVIVLSSAMAKQLLASTGISPEKVVVCYPFVNLAEQTLAGDRLASLFPPGFVHLVYSGALGEKQNPAGLADIIEGIAADLPSTRVHIFSEGRHFDWLKQRLQHVGGVDFHPLVAESDLPELYQRADIQLIPQAPGTQHGSMPSKLPNILASGKAILAICDADSELEEIIRRFQAGICIHTWDPKAASAALAQLAQASGKAGPARRDPQPVRDFFSLDRLITAVAEL